MPSPIPNGSPTNSPVNAPTKSAMFSFYHNRHLHRVADKVSVLPYQHQADGVGAGGEGTGLEGFEGAVGDGLAVGAAEGGPGGGRTAVSNFQLVKRHHVGVKLRRALHRHRAVERGSRGGEGDVEAGGLARGGVAAATVGLG